MRRRAAAPVVQAAPVSQPDAQQMQSAHHAHIVLGDDGDRVVMTVAVRGSAVNVTLKTADDHTAAALARNAGCSTRRCATADSISSSSRPSTKRRASSRNASRASPEQRESRSNEPFELEEQV